MPFILAPAAPLALKAGAAGTTMLYSTATGQYVAAATTAMSPWLAGTASGIAGLATGAAAYAQLPQATIGSAYLSGLTLNSIPWYATGQSAATSIALEAGRATTIISAAIGAYYAAKGAIWAYQNPEEAKETLRNLPEALKETGQKMAGNLKALFRKEEAEA